ncbi:DUF4178 domain-containing protein [Andreprevotia chitinilytica]|uniref:DUF4178 domain-containing protein n=1 Tax=Andreprevotia chitinilytica TaxID=396808 RepID=UPI00068BD8E6|nr:DUF4178 domain-containing protein [Andreprevotia chitinilytica]
MAVCEYCRSTLLRDADTVRDQGKMSAVLEDYSRIRIGTAGNWKGKAFSVVGRIQLRYDAGLWNEWYVLFDDNTAAWLADASGQYLMTTDLGPAADAPVFENLRPEQRYTHDGKSFAFSDVRTARCTGGEGELPFKVGEGWEAKVADARAGSSFLTLDYSDGPAHLYVGEAVTLEGLACQLLREPEQIAETAGRLPGRPNVLDCPSCGSPLTYAAGMATQLVCPACHAEVDCTGDKAEVLKKHTELSHVVTTLSPGDEAKIDGIKWSILGVMQCAERDDESSQWTEYLLYNTNRGFQWLVESSEGWERVMVLDDWPERFTAESATFKGKEFHNLYNYAAVVRYAAGAFNWRASVGDVTWIADYKGADGKLTKEATPNEIGWSRSMPVPAQQVGQWFGKKEKLPEAASQADEGSLLWPAVIAIIVMVLFNLPMLIKSDDSEGIWIVMFIAGGLLWWPASRKKKD